jgi:hypothetical protein
MQLGIDLVRSRVKSLGRLGSELYVYLMKEFKNIKNIEKIVSMKTSDQFKEAMRLQKNYKNKNNKNKDLAGLALSLLVCRAAVQIRLGDEEIKWLAETSVVSLEEVKLKLGDVTPLQLEYERDKKYYRIKQATGRGLKSNVWFSDVWESCVQICPSVAKRFYELSGYTRNFTNDQASVCVLSSIALARLVNDPVPLIIRMIHDPDGCKNLTVALKASGANSTDLGSLLCESVCLQGMPEAPINLLGICKERCSKDFDVIKFDYEHLSACINDILDAELDMSKYEYDDPEHIWASRWAWSTNGGHSRNIEKYEKKWRIDTSERMYRKSALENIRENGIKDFSGKVYVGASVKPELGKAGRAIMACDTISYVAFHHLLAPVEKAWRNRRVLLDPGRKGSSGIADMVRRIGKHGLNVMLDYDSFDTQHSLLAQKMVISQLIEKIGYPADLGIKLINSFDNMLIHCGGDLVGKATHALMSGHRGTSFINGVLNASYIKMCLGKRWYRMGSIHTGDDVYASFSEVGDIDVFFSEAKKYNIKMNPMKQSIGYVSAEFLRVCITEEYSVGYAMRSLARCVSGNWEVEDTHDPSQSLSVWMSMSWTLRNRCRSTNLLRCLVQSMERTTRIGKKKAESIMLGYRGIDGSPIMDTVARWQGYHVDRKVDDELSNRHLEANDKLLASRQYLSECLSEVEYEALKRLRVDVLTDMGLASYAKNSHIKDQSASIASIDLRPLPVVNTKGSVEYENMNRDRDENCGILLKYPVLSMYKDKLNYEDIAEIFRMLNISITESWRVQAWGEDFGFNVVHGNLSFSDAASCSRYVDRRIVYVRRLCYV